MVPISRGSITLTGMYVFAFLLRSFMQNRLPVLQKYDDGDNYNNDKDSGLNFITVTMMAIPVPIILPMMVLQRCRNIKNH